MQFAITPNEPFATAAEIWLQSRKFDGPAAPHGIRRRHRYVGERTLRSYAQYIRSLNQFFGCISIGEITAGHLRKYQVTRAPHAGPNKINQELGLLIQVLKRGEVWSLEFEEAYEPLQYEEGEIPRALSPEEQEHFLSVASSQERWRVIYCYALIVLNTTSSSYEMRGLRLGDVSRGDAMIYVRWGKNKYRVRSVPLLEDGQWAITQLIERARVLGARDPQHYLFPMRLITNMWDPTRPVSDWGSVKPWNEVRSSAGFPWFQINALRHTALTRYAEAGTPIEIMKSYAGHISEKMTRHYVQIGETVKRRYAVAAAQKKPTRIGAVPPWAQSM
jgi:integrase